MGSGNEVAPLNLYLVDRSRYEAGLDHCLRERYLTYHAGPHGTGWQRRAQSVPAVTGNLVHTPITGIFQDVRAEDRLPSDEQVYAHIQRARTEYQRIVESRGLSLTMGEDLERRTQEQLTLLEGLVWAWVKTQLPAYHATYKVVLVEREFVTVYGCTCGLGDGIGTGWDHDARGCAGIGWMTRADVVGQRRDTGTYAYHEFKTTSDDSMNWEAAWAYRVQMIAGILGAEQMIGAPIDEVYVPALIKGPYKSEWNPETRKADGPKFQNSKLVYGWYRPANPPLQSAAWAIDYNYVDELGKPRRLTKDYVRTGVWTLSPAIWQANGALSPSHYWTAWIGDTLREQVRIIGPIYRKDWKLEQFLRQLVAHETHWEQTLWALAESELGWGDLRFQALLDERVPQARGSACHSFFGDTCPHVGLCERHEGWEDPSLIGMVPRRPHHQPELDQAIARGLWLPEDVGEEGAE